MANAEIRLEQEIERQCLKNEAQLARMNLVNFDFQAYLSKISGLIDEREKMVAVLLKRKGKIEEPK